MDKIDQVLTRRVEKIYPGKEALAKRLRSGQKIRVYQGFDPSTPNLHIGHLVGLLKLKEFQSLGHEVIFLIGDFTGRVGDPTGKLSARPQLTEEAVEKNAQTYQKQAGLVLNFSGSNPVKLLFNRQWLSKLSLADFLNLSRHLTYKQVVKREMFKKRLQKNQDIYLNEFLYPLLQGYDSVAMDVDLEIGGSDQTFNMLIGKDLMKKLKNKEKYVLTTKLLVDSKGNKIGKTAGNAINLNNPPHQFFGQIMNLSDEAIIPCFELITEVPLAEIRQFKKKLQSGQNPLNFKKQLAFQLVKMLHDQKTAQSSQANFERVFQKKILPKSIPTFKIKPGKYAIVDLLMKTKLCSSRSEAKRLIKQGAVEVNQSTINNQQSTIEVKDGLILRVGKREFLKLSL